MKVHAWMLLACLATGAAQGADLFLEDRKLRPIAQGDALVPTDTVGGYAFYPGEGKWKFTEGKADMVLGPTTFWMGNAAMSHKEGNNTIAYQYLSANLNRSNDSPGWHSGPCTVERVVKKVVRFGNTESCLTVDVNANQSGALFFWVTVTNTAAAGRYFQHRLAFVADFLGHRGTSTNDWSPASLQANPRRKEFIDKMTAWADKLQAASVKAFEAGQAGDFYKDVPSYLTLLPVPEDLRGGDFSFSFLGAVEDLKNREGFKAIAYSKTSPGVTRWANSVGQPTQGDADKQAVDVCERERVASRPPCALYRPK